MKIAFIDHYDSFSFNVIDWLQTAGSSSLTIEYVPYDDTAKMLRLVREPMPVVVSPGPKRPEDVPQTLEVISALWGKVPLLGICLGHQIFGHLMGATIERCPRPIHGATKNMHILKPHPIFAGVGEFASMATYNSLYVCREGLQSPVQILAVDEDDQIQAMSCLADGAAPAIGLQFHPESFLSKSGSCIAKNWLNMVEDWL